MSIYAIGDVQGCYDELRALLDTFAFDPLHDQLWFAGDLVNRGTQSLEVLRFVKSLNNAAITILGNHDIHLLSLANGHPFKDHTMHDVLAAPDCQELIDWVRSWPFIHYNAALGYALLHAGLPPQWHIEQALHYASEVETALRSDKYPELLQHIYGNTPNQWHEDLAGWDRLRFIVNALTRLRFCNAAGVLDLVTTGEIGSQPPGYLPWFEVPNRASQDTKILFGHWAALQGKADAPNVFALDTGCVWGGFLTALRLGDGRRFQVLNFLA